MGNCSSSLFSIYRNSYNFRASPRQLSNLSNGGVNIGGISICHTLDNYRRTTSYSNTTDINRDTQPSLHIQ